MYASSVTNNYSWAPPPTPPPIPDYKVSTTANTAPYKAGIDQLLSQGPDKYGFGHYQSLAEQELTGGYHTFYEDALKNLTLNPNDTLQNLGSYKFALQQGMEGMSRSAAAQGNARSTTTTMNLGKYAAGLASQTYNDMYKNLQGSLSTAYQGTQMKTGVLGDLATRGLSAYNTQLGGWQNMYDAQAKELMHTNELNMQYKIAQANAKAQAKATKSSGWGSALGAVAGLAMTAFSDRRLKTDVKQIAITDAGLPVYKFRYVWGEGAIGCMADEVARVIPSAVIEGTNGYLMVDYSQII